MNNSIRIPTKHKKDLGSRTDVLYHLGGKVLKVLRFVGKKYSMNPKYVLKKDGVKFLILKHGWNSSKKRIRRQFWELISLGIGVKISPVRKILLELRRTLKSDPNMGILAITHILKSQCLSLTVIGCDFYVGEYYPGYIVLSNLKFNLEKRRLESKTGKWTEKNNHSIKNQLYYLDNLCKKDKRLVISNELKKVLKRKEAESR